MSILDSLRNGKSISLIRRKNLYYILENDFLGYDKPLKVGETIVNCSNEQIDTHPAEILLSIRILESITEHTILDFAMYERFHNGTTEEIRVSDWYSKAQNIECRIVPSLNEVKFETVLLIKDTISFLLFEAANIVADNIQITKCKNCNKYFIPQVRADEIYCDNIFKGDKTCKQMGYEIKVNSDQLMKAYRTAYKTKNASKNRNKKNNTHAEDEFKQWVYLAKQKLEEAQNKIIEHEEFIEWLKK